MKTIPYPLDDNIRTLQARFTDCGDFVGRKFPVSGFYVYMAYIDLLIDRELIDQTLMEQLFNLKIPSRPRDLFSFLRDHGLPTVDLTESDDFEETVKAILAGDTVLYMDGCDKAVVISTKGYPNRGVPTAETEVVVQGPKEAFSEAFRVNTALVRRRIKDTRLKIKQSVIGEITRTPIALVYLEGIARPQILREIEERIAGLTIDGIMDGGMLEQLLVGKGNRRSPFPSAQLTERPDKVASSILEGRIAIIVDGSPFVLLVPVTMNTLFQSSEDYYQHWLIMSLTRLLRYAGAFLAVALPGFYIAAAVYHPSMIPLQMAVKMSAARLAVPFPALVEILLMDAAFELLREAGIRLPGAAGGTIGIVGGLIIGQAAVEAGLCSPVVVIVVALAGIASFAIPNISLMNGLRMIKYLVLLLSSVLGLLGFCGGLLLALSHLAGLRSFGVPFLLPYAAGEMNGCNDLQDSAARQPLDRMKNRPFFAMPGSRKRQS
ncbi:MAG: spore germination protein [Clostridiales bacterium]|nr:spore germination protein [Clostridiales bacterium]